MMSPLAKYSDVLRSYRVDTENLISDPDGSVPLIYWPNTPNFGDLLSPWLVSKLTGRAVRHVPALVTPIRPLERLWHKLRHRASARPNYISVGSIVSRAKDRSIVWGSGTFGTEQFGQLNKRADYRAVRGPLTRQLLRNVKIAVPEVYGDPALLSPLVFPDPGHKTHDVGIVLRWPERRWLQSEPGEGVILIDLGSPDVEATLNQILACKRIITSSLHGLIISDAYGLPSAYLGSDTPKGGIFKFMDYFASVQKFRDPQFVDIAAIDLSVANIDATFTFDARPITYDPTPLLDACPFLTKA